MSRLSRAEFWFGVSMIIAATGDSDIMSLSAMVICLTALAREHRPVVPPQ